MNCRADTDGPTGSEEASDGDGSRGGRGNSGGRGGSVNRGIGGPRRGANDAGRDAKQAFDTEVSVAAGVRNAADGALVTLMVRALAHGLWEGSGIHSPAQWLSLRAGLARGTARKVVLIATRAASLPVTLRLLGEGRLSLDQAAMVARYSPAQYEASVCEVAVNATVEQIRTATRHYAFDSERPADPERASSSPKGDNRQPTSIERSVSWGADDDGQWWARVRLAANEGQLVETALKATRDHLHSVARADAKAQAEAEGRPAKGTDRSLRVPRVTWADALVHLAHHGIGCPGKRRPDFEQTQAGSPAGPTSGSGSTSAAASNSTAASGSSSTAGSPSTSASVSGSVSALRRPSTEAWGSPPGAPPGPAPPGAVSPDSPRLASGISARSSPGDAPVAGSRAPRAVVHLHLERPKPGCGDRWLAELHGGPRLPDSLRRYLTCDCDIETVWTAHGIPVTTARRRRVTPERVRRLVEHRDRYRCVVPACDSTLWLQTHHIVHWEDGGPTTTDNLCCLCSHHHRLHHQGTLGIAGNADVELTFTNQYRLPITAGGAAAPLPGDMPSPLPYDGPTGEVLQKRWVDFGRHSTGPPPRARR